MGIYRQATAPAYEEGGLWFDSDDNDKPYYGSGGSWVALNPGSLFTDFSDTDHVQDADVLLGQRGAGGVNYLGSHFVKKEAGGNYKAGGQVDFPNGTAARPGGPGQYILVADSGGLYQQAGGNYYLVTTSGGSTSDAFRKENIKNIDNALLRICSIRGVSYTRKDLESGNDEAFDSAEVGVQLGVIAQEIKEQFPEIVSGEEGSMTVRYDRLVPPLIEAVKELAARLAELEARQ